MIMPMTAAIVAAVRMVRRVSPNIWGGPSPPTYEDLVRHPVSDRVFSAVAALETLHRGVLEAPVPALYPFILHCLIVVPTYRAPPRYADQDERNVCV